MKRPRQRRSKENIVAAIQGKHKNSSRLNSNYMQKHDSALFASAVNHFGSWRQAIESAGLDYSKICVQKLSSKRVVKKGLSAVTPTFQGYLPFLTDLESKNLSKKVLKRDGDLEARNKLVERNLPLVIRIAKSFPIGSTGVLDFEDLVQVGRVGLIEAAEKYDYQKSKFSTYANYWIFQSIQRAIQGTAETVRVPVHKIGEFQKVRQAMRIFQEKFKCQPPASGIAKELGWTVRKVKKLLLQMQAVPNFHNQTLISLDFGGDQDLQNSDNYSDWCNGLHELLADKYKLTPEQLFQAKEELRLAYERLQKIYVSLKTRSVSDRNIEIFKKYYGLDGSWELETLESVGEHFKVTRERIRQIKESVILKIKKFGFENEEAFYEEIERIKTLQTLTNQL